MLNFSMWERKHNMTKVTEDYCWAISWAAGQLCCGRSGSTVLELNFNWTPLYIHIELTIYILYIYMCVCVCVYVYICVCVCLYTEFHLAQNLTFARNLQNVTSVYAGECLY
jgi:hypothetical protein